MRRWVVLLAAAQLWACGSDETQPAATGQQRCTAAPDCGGCLNCYSTCLCTTGDSSACESVCGLAGSGGSAGGSSGGAGGSSGASPGGTGGVPPGGSGGVGGSGGTSTQPSPAGGLRITEVAVYQGVKIPIMQNGAEINTRNASVVADRPALLRVSVAPDAGFTAREVIGRLELTSATLPALEQRLFVAGPSTDGDLQSTFSFNVPAAEMKAGVGYSVSLVEVSGPSQGDPSGSRWPSQGTSSFGALSANGAFRVVVVPLVVNGNTPDTSPQRMQQLHDRLFAMYPVQQVEINVHAPVAYSGTIEPTGTGWRTALDFVMSLRSQENPPPPVYYYGMLTPTTSAVDYCGGPEGCVAGLSGLPQPGTVSQRASIGLGYFQTGGGYNAADTMAHEVGHSLGRPHAPCNTPDAPAGFPYVEGGIGDWGYDLVLGALRAPTTYKDIMGYCTPYWISDYTYERLFQRISFVNSQPYLLVTDPLRQPGRFRVLIIDDHARLTWGSTLDIREPMMEPAREVELFDAAGNAVGSVVGYYTPFDHLDGGFVFVRESALSYRTGIAALRPAGLTVRPLAL